MAAAAPQRLCVYVTPKAPKNSIGGFKADAQGKPELCVAVTAAPEDGKATKAVCECVAKSLGIAKGKVACTRGETSRHKQLAIDIDPAVLEPWLEKHASA